jgi:hypothetical protein
MELMMSKVVQAINAIISNPDQISNVLKTHDQIFFLYKGKYKWSMSETDEDDHYLCFYPGDEDIGLLVEYEERGWEDVPRLAYSAKDIGTKEAKASFSELYTLIEERLYGVNEVLDDIISDLEYPGLRG